MVDALANTPEVADGRINDDIYDFIERMAQRKLGGRKMGRQFAKAIFEGVVDMAFKHAIQTGQFRFPKGYGTLYLRTLKATKKKLPNGEWIDLSGDRVMLRYNEGLSVRELLGKPAKSSQRKAKKQAEPVPELSDAPPV